VVFGPFFERLFHVEVIMALQLRDTQQVALSAAEVDEHGHPTPVDDGSFVWASSDPTVVEVIDNGDGTAVARTLGVIGTAQVNVTDTNDDLTGQLQIDVVPGPPSAISIVAGEPTDLEPTP